VELKLSPGKCASPRRRVSSSDASFAFLPTFAAVLSSSRLPFLETNDTKLNPESLTRILIKAYDHFFGKTERLDEIKAVVCPNTLILTKHEL